MNVLSSSIDVFYYLGLCFSELELKVPKSHQPYLSRNISTYHDAVQVLLALTDCQLVLIHHRLLALELFNLSLALVHVLAQLFLLNLRLTPLFVLFLAVPERLVLETYEIVLILLLFIAVFDLFHDYFLDVGGKRT